jgi:hypothetical protein
MIMKTIFTIILLFDAFVHLGHAQGTIQFGFEEYPLGAVPPFIRNLSGFTPQIHVADTATDSAFPLIEGSKFLFAAGATAMASPDGQPIKAYSLLFNTLGPAAGYNGGFSIDGGYVARVEDYGKWTKASGSFETPVCEIMLNGVQYSGEYFPLAYAIDAVEFQTVPEPRVISLVLVGIGLGLLRKQTRQHFPLRQNGSAD